MRQRETGDVEMKRSKSKKRGKTYEELLKKNKRKNVKAPLRVRRIRGTKMGE